MTSAMNIQRKFTDEEAQHIIEHPVHRCTNWRWGHQNTYIVAYDGKWYEVNIRFHSQDGAQLHEGVYGHEVVPVKVETTKYVRVNT